MLFNMYARTILQVQEKEFEMTLKEFERALRENAIPPIKGEITRNKVKWRGIRIVTSIKTGYSWLEQRGRKISNEIKLSRSIDEYK